MGSSSGWRFDRSQNGRATRLGWTYVHVAVDEHSRLAYVEELSDEHPPTTIGFVRRAIDFYVAAHGVRISRLLTDNGTPTDHEPSPPQPTSSSSDTCATCPTHQGPRQGRSDAQDPYQQMGLREGLRLRRRAFTSPSSVPRLLQSRASTRRLGRRPTDRPGPSMMPWSGTTAAHELHAVGVAGVHERLQDRGVPSRRLAVSPGPLGAPGAGAARQVGVMQRDDRLIESFRCQGGPCADIWVCRFPKR